MFGSGVPAKSRYRHLPQGRRNVDNAPRLLRPHVRDDGLHEAGVAEYVHLELMMRSFHRNTFNRTQLGVCGVIHQYIDAPFR